MGNCIKGIRESSLLEPLIDSENENNVLKERIDMLTTEIENIKKSMYVLEQNTTENLKLLSDDLHYVNEKINDESTEPTESTENHSID